ncbi:MAG: hypothetical protein ABSB70_00795 [Candidatus Velthaea sp.]
MVADEVRKLAKHAAASPRENRRHPVWISERDDARGGRNAHLSGIDERLDRVRDANAEFHFLERADCRRFLSLTRYNGRVSRPTESHPQLQRRFLSRPDDVVAGLFSEGAQIAFLSGTGLVGGGYPAIQRGRLSCSPNAARPAIRRLSAAASPRRAPAPER